MLPYYSKPCIKNFSLRLFLSVLCFSASVIADPIVFDPNQVIHRLVIIGAPQDDTDAKLDRDEKAKLDQYLAVQANFKAGSTYTFLLEPTRKELQEYFSSLKRVIKSNEHLVVAISAHGNSDTWRPGEDELYDEYIRISRGTNKGYGKRAQKDDEFLSDDEYASLLASLGESISSTTIMNVCKGGGFSDGADDRYETQQHQFIAVANVCYVQSATTHQYRSVWSQTSGAIKALKRNQSVITAQDVKDWINRLDMLESPLGSPDDVSAYESNKLRVIYFKMDKAGNSSLILSPTGKVILIDGGFSSNAENILETLKKFKITTIDLIISTHDDNDHIGGLTKLLKLLKDDTSISIKKIWRSPYKKEGTQLARKFDEAASGISLRTRKADSALHLSLFEAPGLTGKLIAPSRAMIQDPSSQKANTNSLITRLQYKNIKFLFTGDATNKTEDYLLNRYGNKKGGLLDVDIINSPHHGSRHSNQEKFIKAVTPRVVVFSSNAGNQYGHPHDDIIKRYQQTDSVSHTLWTAETGTIMIETDGTHCTIFAEYQQQKPCWDEAPSPFIGTMEREVQRQEQFASSPEVIFKTPIYEAYVKGPKVTKSYNIYTYVRPEVVKKVKLKVSAFDVDHKKLSYVDPKCNERERNAVFLNNKHLGYLTGETGKDSVTEFLVDRKTVNWKGGELWGTNEVRIILGETNNAHCKWGTKINYVAITAEQKPLVFIPGILGTELFSKGLIRHEVPLWGRASGLIAYKHLELNPKGDGPAKERWNVWTGNILRSFRTLNGRKVLADVYGPFLDEYLPSIGYYSISSIDSAKAAIRKKNHSVLRTTPMDPSLIRLKELPYDWRKDNAITAKRLDTVIKSIKQKTTLSPILIAHSMGGLVAKHRIMKHGSDDISMLFTIGTPFTGAPKAFTVAHFGEGIFELGFAKRKTANFFRKKLSFMTKGDFKRIAQSMPSVHQLMPSQHYFDYNAPILVNQRQLTSARAAYLTDITKMTSGKHHAQDAFSFRNAIANTFPRSLDVTRIIGETTGDTVVQVIHKSATDYKHIYGPGDETVPSISAAPANRSGPNIKKYSFNESHVPLPNNQQIQNVILKRIEMYNSAQTVERPPILFNPLPPSSNEPTRCLEHQKMDPIPRSKEDKALKQCLKKSSECSNFSEEDSDWGIEGCVQDN